MRMKETKEGRKEGVREDGGGAKEGRSDLVSELDSIGSKKNEREDVRPSP